MNEADPTGLLCVSGVCLGFYPLRGLEGGANFVAGAANAVVSTATLGTVHVSAPFCGTGLGASYDIGNWTAYAEGGLAGVGEADLAAESSVVGEEEGGAALSESEGPTLVYRNGSATPTNLTPRPGIDVTGLSTFDNPAAFESGTKLQIIDVSQLKTLEANPDEFPLGHVSLAPADQALLEEWAATRGTGVVHPLTQEIMDAIIGTVRAP